MTDLLYMYYNSTVFPLEIFIRNLRHVTERYLNVFWEKHSLCLLVLFEYVLLGIEQICELLVDLKVVRCKRWMSLSVKGYRSSSLDLGCTLGQFAVCQSVLGN